MEEEENKLEIERDQDLEEQLPAEEFQPQKWTDQITLRGLLVSMMIGIMYSIIAMKLNLTTGMVPNLNVSAALLAFVFVRSWTKVLHKAGLVSKPFTRQENTIIQTCAVACYSIAVGGSRLYIYIYILFTLLNEFPLYMYMCIFFSKV